MKRLLYFIPCLIASIQVWSQSEEQTINIEAAYVGEYFSNFSGGLNTGQTYLGLIDFGIGFNTANIGLWQNGEFAVMIENTHGGHPSADYIGDLQVASNIENGDFTYLYEMWYKHSFKNFCLKLGILDLNADCHVSEYAGLFLNSSFGIMPSASLNMPVPIFPLPALGLLVDYKFSDRLSFLAGIWDGNPGDFEENRYNIEWSLSNKEGFLYMAEGQYRYGSEKNNRGTIKIGTIYHSGSFNTFDSTQYKYGELVDTTQFVKGNLEFHLIAEHNLVNKSEGQKGKLDAFLQLGYTPKETISHTPLYIGAGINCTGLLKASADDILGIGLAYIKTSPHISEAPQFKPYEMAIELTYSFPILENLTIQPDLQYIINPGANINLNNSLMALLRFYINVNN